jgi:hypothetical protein
MNFNVVILMKVEKSKSKKLSSEPLGTDQEPVTKGNKLKNCTLLGREKIDCYLFYICHGLSPKDHELEMHITQSNILPPIFQLQATPHCTLHNPLH